MITGPRIQTIGIAILKRLGFFSLEQIREETGLSRESVRKAIRELEKKKMIRVIKAYPLYEWKGSRPRMMMKCSILNKKALLAKINPQSKDGEHISANRMWKVIRYKGTFELTDLIKLANVKRETARSFIKELRKGGFIMPSKPTGRGVYWTLIKDVGPRRPYVGGAIQKAEGRRQKAEGRGQKAEGRRQKSKGGNYEAI